MNKKYSILCFINIILPCAVCYVPNDTPLAQGTNNAVFFLLGIIIFILLFLGLKGLPVTGIKWLLEFISWKDVIYYLMLGVTLFTAITGISYLYDNRLTIKRFLN